MRDDVERTETNVVDGGVQVLSESKKSLQVVKKLYEKHLSEGRYFMHAHPEDSKSWHETFVKKLSSEERVVKVKLKMDGIAKPFAWWSNAPMITKRLSVLQRSRQFHPKTLVAAIFTDLRGQLKTREHLREHYRQQIEARGGAGRTTRRAAVHGQSRSLARSYC